MLYDVIIGVCIMLEMYYKYRVEYKDFLLFIKVGSFYELFDNDSLKVNTKLQV